jgi:tRNA G10  N-methylase Trm11
LTLPAAAIKEDQRLEKQASSASEELARHRWHWTLDTENPKRVPIREYAREVGRSKSVIEGQAKGYANWIGGLAGEASLSESIERAKMSTEKAAVTEAISEARGTSFKHTRATRPTEIRRVREIARERAEKHGTPVEEEAKKVAEWVVKSEKADARNQQGRSSSRRPCSGTMLSPPETTISGYGCACDVPMAPTRPAVVLDPFAGTGTVAMVARALGRVAVNVDLSMDYCRLARWRIYTSGHAAKCDDRTHGERQEVLW